ncbi:hypothetical protein BBP40_012047 [Aspergillus hancockii]|nr:hypothetical protein BBP40_012047 [Aspergillus hancockii]
MGWVCALPVELAAAQEMLDEKHGDLVISSEDNIYTLGRVGEHNVVIACLPEGQMGTNPAAAAAARMQSAFTSIRFGLMVGIGGGVPSTKLNIRLGDVVVSRPENNHAGVVQYDFGKSTPSGFKRTGFLNAPPKILQTAVSHQKAKHMRRESQLSEYILKLAHLPAFTQGYAEPDVLFESHYNHVGGTTCESCDKQRMLRRPTRDQLGPEIHYGTIASGNQVVRDAAERDRVSSHLGGVLCFEMEPAGRMNEFPCLVIRGICDYSGSHKNKTWQPYAAGVAAAYAKELLSVIPPVEVRQSTVVKEIVNKSAGVKRFFTVPFQGADKFVGRESIVANLDDKFQSTALHNHLRVALVGIGGIGHVNIQSIFLIGVLDLTRERKSQIAIEYAYRARQRNPKLSVFWVQAGNAARFEQAYIDLADELGLPGRANPDVDVFKMVPRWLMILDNADNEEHFTQDIEVGIKPNLPKTSARAPHITSIPQTANGSVIITSRSTTAARNLLGIHDNIIPVDVMDENSALDLLQTKVTFDKQSLANAQRLLQALEYIPLAIIQAGSYIQAKSPRITVLAYLKMLQESEASLVALLGSMDVKDSRRDYNSQHVVTATWQISFHQMQASKSVSSDLLALMSIFDRQRIPEYLLRQNMT